MRKTGPEIESSALRFGGIAQTIILSAVAAAICTLFKVHALTEAQASIALFTALPTVMTILVRRDTKE
ncbi:hypothetical protein [Sphingobium vermicomposti]|uniref:Uncharacterized protein n=1 Tax=Sphingobium vermicomposti TaxID=529005 RepID=A0A846M874_9SPHN|nr:hypothetical protein [Sphingobium vermicomposti]NIJ16304.1 hypothetical protein [Sphingobium vermicomposti]